jgi:hypothetical protein
LQKLHSVLGREGRHHSHVARVSHRSWIAAGHAGRNAAISAVRIGFIGLGNIGVLMAHAPPRRP